MYLDILKCFLYSLELLFKEGFSEKIKHLSLYNRHNYMTDALSVKYQDKDKYFLLNMYLCNGDKILKFIYQNEFKNLRSVVLQLENEYNIDQFETKYPGYSSIMPKIRCLPNLVKIKLIFTMFNKSDFMVKSLLRFCSKNLKDLTIIMGSKARYNGDYLEDNYIQERYYKLF